MCIRDRLDEVAPVDPPATRPTESAVAATILVVEDEEALLRLATRILRSAGYTVLVAANGEEARRMLEGDHPRVDLMLTECSPIDATSSRSRIRRRSSCVSSTRCCSRPISPE